MAMRSLQIAMRTEQAAMRTKLLQEISSVRSEQAAMSAELSSVRSEQAIVRSELSSVRESLSQMTNVLNSVAASVLSLVVSNGHTRALPHTAAALPKRSHSEDDNPRSDVLVKTEQFDEQLDEHLYKRVKSESSSPFTPPPLSTSSPRLPERSPREGLRVLSEDELLSQDAFEGPQVQDLGSHLTRVQQGQMKDFRDKQGGERGKRKGGVLGWAPPGGNDGGILGWVPPGGTVE
ncbi:hypothetical protein TrRE_jg2245 [Triparma retinervis]|uniref:Uncharacterized protein n=1 Tax=Triparma retinervis TaxID=2557542 RepID=A0A9W7G2S4_9STRA|nr:hypothetical protein TrRE_jg2245 [Triparma retinervis]